MSSSTLATLLPPSPFTMSSPLPPRMPDRPRSAPIEPKSSSSLSSGPPPRPSYPPPPPALLSRSSSLTVLLSSAITPSLARSALLALRSFQTSASSLAQQLQIAAALDAAAALHALVDLTGLYHESAPLQALALAALADWRLSSHALAALPAAEAAETVCAALRTHGARPAVAAPALHCLASLAAIHAQADSLDRCGALPLANDVLAKHEGNVGVAVAAARFFGAAAGEPGNSGTVASDGALERLLKSLRAAPRDLELALLVSAAVRNVTVGSEDARKMAVKLGCLGDLVGVLRRHGRSVEAVVHALAGLYHVLFGGEGNAERVGQVEGWADAICEVARTHFDRHVVQTLVMGVGAGLNGDGMREELVRKGAVQVAVNGMHRHVTHRDVLYYGSRFLRGLLEGCEEGMEEVRNCGGVERLLDLLYCSVARPAGVEVGERYAGYAEGL